MRLLCGLVLVWAATASNIRVDNQYQNERSIHVTYDDQIELMLVFQKWSQVALLKGLEANDDNYAGLLRRLKKRPEFQPNFFSESALEGVTSNAVIGSASFLTGELNCHYRTGGWFARINTKDMPEGHWIKSRANVVSGARNLCSFIHNIRSAVLETVSLDDFSDSYLASNMNSIDSCHFSSDWIQGYVAETVTGGERKLSVQFRSGVGQYTKGMYVGVKDNSPSVRCAVARELAAQTQAVVGSAYGLQEATARIAREKGGSP